MNKDEFVLAAMAPAGTGAFSRVQIQKALFLLDRNIGELTNGPHFDFTPYHYGPFDPEVYRALEELERDGLITISRDPAKPSPMYALTPAGLAKGRKELDGLEQRVQDFIRNTVHFVRTVSFTDLVTAIYREYPEMAENSVVARRHRTPHPTSPR